MAVLRDYAFRADFIRLLPPRAAVPLGMPAIDDYFLQAVLSHGHGRRRRDTPALIYVRLQSAA